MYLDKLVFNDFFYLRIKSKCYKSMFSGLDDVEATMHSNNRNGHLFPRPIVWIFSVLHRQKNRKVSNQMVPIAVSDRILLHNDSSFELDVYNTF